MEDLHSIVKIKDFGHVSLKLNLLMDEYKINRNTLRLNTGTQFSVIDKWYSGKVEKLDLDILARICYVKRNNISYNMSLPVWRAIFLPCPKKPYSASFAAMQ